LVFLPVFTGYGKALKERAQKRHRGRIEKKI